MSKHTIIEPLLRPPIEWYSTCVSLSIAWLIYASPSTFMIPIAWSHWIAGSLGLLGLWRFYQGLTVVRYQRQLRKLPRWTLAPKKLPIHKKRLFLGRGFRWTGKHTQRLNDLTLPQHERYALPSKGYQWARKCERAWGDIVLLKYIARLTAKDVWWNPFYPMVDGGGYPALHGVSLSEKNLCIDMLDRFGHSLVLGTTRIGKSRFAELLITQDIHLGDVVIVFDPKGDADLLRRIVFEAKRAGRENDVRVFHLGFPEQSNRYNPIASFVRVTEVGNRIANQLPGSGESAAFKSFGWRFVNIITQALVLLGRRPDYKQIAKHLMHIDDLFVDYCTAKLYDYDPKWEEKVAEIDMQLDEKSLPSSQQGKSPWLIALVKYIEKSNFYDSIAQGLASAFNYDKTYFDKITASLLPLLEQLTTGQCVSLLSPDYNAVNDKRDILDWFQVIRNKQIVYIGLDALTDITVASAVGNSMFSDLVSVAGRLYNHGVHHGFYRQAKNPEKTLPIINIHSDEFNELIGDEFIPLINKGGGSGMRVTAYTQTLSDIEARLGNKAKAGQVIGNFNNLFMFRVTEPATANLLTNRLGKVKVHELMAVSSVSDASHKDKGVHFHSSNEDRIATTEVPMLSHNDIGMLPKGHAFCLINGGQLFKLRVPLSPITTMDLPHNIEQLCQQMATHYYSASYWWQLNNDSTTANTITMQEEELNASETDGK